MSANRNRLTSALRRIVKTDPEVRSLLTAADSKGGKPGAAGVGSSTEAKQAQVCCDGTVGDANPGTEERDPTDGDQTGLDPNDPADLSGLDGGCLTGVTNCDTGDPICFCGDDFIPPDGWDGPTEPPVDTYYDSNFYYVIIDESNGSIVSQSNGCTSITQEFNELQQENCGSSIDLDAFCDGSLGSGASFNCGGVQRRIERLPCDGESVCNDPQPLLEKWPADSCVNLAVKGGSIVGSKYDPENDGSYSAPVSEIQLCDGANSMYLAPSATGGWKSIDSTKTSGYLYGSDFKLIAHIDGNEYSDPAI